MPSCLISRSPFEFLTIFFDSSTHEARVKNFKACCKDRRLSCDLSSGQVPSIHIDLSNQGKL